MGISAVYAYGIHDLYTYITYTTYTHLFLCIAGLVHIPKCVVCVCVVSVCASVAISVYVSVSVSVFVSVSVLVHVLMRQLNEDDTTSSSRIFIKILFQEISEYLGLPKLKVTDAPA